MADFDEKEKAKKYIDTRFDNIEEKLRKSFQAIKQDITSIKEGVERKTILAKAKPLQQTSELEAEVTALRRDIHQALSSLQNQMNEQSKTKSLELASAKALAEQIQQLKDSLVTRQEVEKIDTKLSYELAKLKSETERKINEMQKHEIDSDKINEKPMQRIKEIELWLPKTLHSYREESKQEKEEMLKEVKKEISSLKASINEKDSQIDAFKRQLNHFKSRLNKIREETPEESEEYEEAKKTDSKKEKITWIPFKLIIQIFIALLVILALSSLIIFADPSSLFGLFRVHAEIAPPSTGLNMPLYYNEQNFAFLSGWESKLTYNNKEDRLVGYNTSGKEIGWFYQNANFSIANTKSWGQRKTSVTLLNPNSSNILNASFAFTFLRGKAYSKVEFNAEAKNPALLGSLTYGLTAEGYDIMLPDGRIIKNDLNTTQSHGLQVQNGSSFSLKKADFEIFINPQTNFSFILFSSGELDFANSFADNLFLAKTAKTERGYAPLYIGVFPNAQWIYYEEEGWLVNSKTYTGKLSDFLFESN